MLRLQPEPPGGRWGRRSPTTIDHASARCVSAASAAAKEESCACRSARVQCAGCVRWCTREAHQSPDQGVVARVGGVGILLLEQLVESVFGAGGRGGHIVAEPAEARRTDSDK